MFGENQDIIVLEILFAGSFGSIIGNDLFHMGIK